MSGVDETDAQGHEGAVRTVVSGTYTSRSDDQVILVDQSSTGLDAGAVSRTQCASMAQKHTCHFRRRG